MYLEICLSSQLDTTLVLSSTLREARVLSVRTISE